MTPQRPQPPADAPAHLRTPPGTVDLDAPAPRPELVDPHSPGSLPTVGYARTVAGTTSAGLLAEVPAAGYALVLTDTVEYFRE